MQKASMEGADPVMVLFLIAFRYHVYECRVKLPVSLWVIGSLQITKISSDKKLIFLGDGIETS